jgi:hypothetical protein
MDPALQTWLDAHASEITMQEHGKVRCKLSGHDIPCKLDALEQHWIGRVYRRALKQQVSLLAIATLPLPLPSSLVVVLRVPWHLHPPLPTIYCPLS